MILSFGDKATEQIFNLTFSRKVPHEIQERAYHKLVAIHEAECLENLRLPPGNRLEALGGKLSGFHSIRINGQGRITFRWLEGNALDVTIIDYH